MRNTSENADIFTPQKSIFSFYFILNVKYKKHNLTFLMHFASALKVIIIACHMCSRAGKEHKSHDMRFPTMWYVRPAKAQTSLRIRAVWSEPLLVAWIFYDCWATDRISFQVSKLNRRLHRLVWFYTSQNATLLEITCRGSQYLPSLMTLSKCLYWRM